MKTYVLIISSVFPSYHSRKGESTNFFHNILLGIKKHTIRANYDLWYNRIQEVKKGKAIISIREWIGKPYASKQKELMRIDSKKTICIQKIRFNTPLNNVIIDDEFYTAEDLIAKNDGLTTKDFKEWFIDADLTKEFAIIIFSDNKYKRKEIIYQEKALGELSSLKNLFSPLKIEFTSPSAKRLFQPKSSFRENMTLLKKMGLWPLRGF